MKKLKLNVTLLKQGVIFDEPASFIQDYDSSKEILINEDNLDEDIIDEGGFEEGRFEEDEVRAIIYHKEGVSGYPPWVKSFKSKIGGADLRDVIDENKSHGVSLYLEVSNRVFVINWGISGRFNTQQDKIDKEFGIYVANKLLNSNSSTHIKSAQSRVNQTNPINKERQYGQTISNEQLSLTMEDNEAFKELNITISDSTDFARMIGKYSSLNVQFIFQNNQFPVLRHLPLKLQELLDIYNSVGEEDIKKLFKGIFPVVDDTVTQALNANLKNALVEDDSLFFLFEPEIDFDFSTAENFRFTVDAEISDMGVLKLSDYINIQDNLEMDSLNTDTLSIINEDGDEIKKWSIFECLYGENSFNGKNYILSLGYWFEVDAEKYKRISQKIDAIITEDLEASDDVKERTKIKIQTEIDDPNIKKVFKEKIFNTFWCNDLNGELFDEASKQITLYEDKFEVCDIFIPDEKKFIHVKINSGINALSHLFNQGFVSASAFAKFKNKYIEEVNNNILVPQRYLTGSKDDACIHFVILDNRIKPRLTFFSKMALEDSVTTLEGYGFIVKLSWIRDAYK